MNYDDAYMEYYNKIRKKVKGSNSTSDKDYGDYVYPNTSNVKSYRYSTNNSMGNYKKKSFKYIDGLVIRIIISLILALGVFILKSIPNKEAQYLYNLCKTTINTEYNYTELLESMKEYGFDYEEIKESFAEKYNDFKENINDISDMD